MAITIGDLLSYVDSMKRRGGATLAQIASDPGEALAQMGASLRENMPGRVTQPGLSAGEQFRRVADSEAVLGSSLANVASGFAPMLGGVMTYHGTPHTWAPEPGFPKGRFRLDKIGTGEGAQVYGHGGYFAENQGVGTRYRDNLASNSPTWKYVNRAGIEQQLAPLEEDAIRQAESYLSNTFGKTDFSRVDDALAQLAKRRVPNQQSVEDGLRLIKDRGLDRVFYKDAGSLYAQDLPDEVLPKMLQWDKLLSEQPEAVQKLFSGVERLRDQYVFKKVTTGEALGELSGQLGGREQAAEFLRQRGIPGLSYLDAGSRASGKGTMNHVVWDQELLNRMKPQSVE